MSAYTCSHLNQLVTGNRSGTLSACGWTQTAGLADLAVNAQPAAVFQNADWTAKGLTVPVGDTTLTVTRTAADQTTSQSSMSISRPQDAVQFVHDLNGNLLGEGQWLCTWDAENRLATAESTLGALGRHRLEYPYDGLGRRRSRRVRSWRADHPGYWRRQRRRPAAVATPA